VVWSVVLARQNAAMDLSGGGTVSTTKGRNSLELLGKQALYLNMSYVFS
jgi:hypothetical protein